MQDCFILFILPFAILPLCWNNPTQCNAFRIHRKPNHETTAPRSPSIYSKSQFSRQVEREVQPRLHDAPQTITDSEIASDKSATGDNKISERQTRPLSPIENLLRKEQAEDDNDLDEDDSYPPVVNKRDFSRDRKWFHFTINQFREMMDFLNEQPSGGGRVFSRPRFVG